jgi:hypothetical protein
VDGVLKVGGHVERINHLAISFTSAVIVAPGLSRSSGLTATIRPSLPPQPR